MAFLLLVTILVAQIVLCYDGTAAADGGATSAADFAVADGAQRGSKRKTKAKERPAG